MRYIRWSVCACLVCWLTPAAAAQVRDAREMVKAATQQYRDAWLANDPEAVMRTLTSDPVLLPSGHAAIIGASAVRAFWWPPNSGTTRVTAMELHFDKVDLSGDLAYVRGRGELKYTVETAPGQVSPPKSIRSTFLNILRRQGDGRWLIAERMWSDLPE